ncbi:hypothetical protein L6452_14024 [Arctium lappa]|uniref:Uncharacterized protein n=1 Tax=Arctium lappa TaxID=4217 RepID=A0ACB9CK55_ARCLA|nr:hypothetical protein L6452_14024 [Arctium lappa]
MLVGSGRGRAEGRASQPRAAMTPSRGTPNTRRHHTGRYLALGARGPIDQTVGSYVVASWAELGVNQCDPFSYSTLPLC